MISNCSTEPPYTVTNPKSGENVIVIGTTGKGTTVLPSPEDEPPIALPLKRLLQQHGRQ